MNTFIGDRNVANIWHGNIVAISLRKVISPNEGVMGCIWKDFEENWPRYNGTALYWN